MFKKKQSADKAVLQNAITTLFANIKFSNVDDPVRSLVVTSAVPNEGKSTVAVNLAKTIAASGKNVLLVECDMRRRSLAAMLKVHARAGLYAVLAEQVSLRSAVVATSTPNLFFLDAEPGIPNPADILASKRFDRFVDMLENAYDYVIFDTPPVGTFVDAAVISSRVDGTVLVVRDDFTKRDELLAARDQLDKADAHIIGTVLNNCEVEMGDYYYAYYTKDGKRVKQGETPSLPSNGGASSSAQGSSRRGRRNR